MAESTAELAESLSRFARSVAKAARREAPYVRRAARRFVDDDLPAYAQAAEKTARRAYADLRKRTG